jgi:citrate lyase subunit beta/citryl-CoA lyase
MKGGTVPASSLPVDRHPVRSALFVPANRQSWIEKSPGYGADAVVLDLEDATPEIEKPTARKIVRDLIPFLREHNQDVWIRVNEFGSHHLWTDVEAVCQPGVGAICLPKVTGADAIRELDRVITFMEGRHGIAFGTVGIVPLLETAAAIVDATNVFLASKRVCYGGGLAAAGGDVQRSIGFKWTDGFAETAVLRSQVLLAARAAGVENPVTGLITAVDTTAVSSFAQQSRALGYAGMFVIHPSHVPIANTEFTPSQEELDWANGVLAGYAVATDAGKGAFRDASGSMIDLAHVRTAERIIETHKLLTSRADS